MIFRIFPQKSRNIRTIVPKISVFIPNKSKINKKNVHYYDTLMKFENRKISNVHNYQNYNNYGLKFPGHKFCGIFKYEQFGNVENAKLLLGSQNKKMDLIENKKLCKHCEQYKKCSTTSYIKYVIISFFSCLITVFLIVYGLSGLIFALYFLTNR